MFTIRQKIFMDFAAILSMKFEYFTSCVEQPHSHQQTTNHIPAIHYKILLHHGQCWGNALPNVLPNMSPNALHNNYYFCDNKVI